METEMRFTATGNCCKTKYHRHSRWKRETRWFSEFL